MVCVAAFIILCLISVVVGFLSIFKKDIGAKWWKIFKKAWHCVFKKVRLQKCDTNFKDDVKNSILKRVIIKHPKWVKPISITIEIVAVLIVLITVWSIIIAIKSLLALWVFGTCNVSQPSQCALGAEVCSIDQAEPRTLAEKFGRSLGEWGEIFSAIPDRLKNWDAASFDVPTITQLGNADGTLVLEIMDPGCSVCMQSYRNLQKDKEFLGTHLVKIAIYPIQLSDGNYKFKNSGVIARYLHASTIYQSGKKYAEKILNRIFTERNQEGVIYQTVFNNQLTEPEARELLETWLAEWDASPEVITKISELTNSERVDQLMEQTKQVVEQEIKAKGIPIMIADGRKISGLFKSPEE